MGSCCPYTESQITPPAKYEPDPSTTETYKTATSAQMQNFEQCFAHCQAMYGQFTQPLNSHLIEQVKQLPHQIGQQGDVYYGTWRWGLKHGRGIQSYPDGTVYEGDWMQGYRSGRGRLVMSNGIVYLGDWKEGKLEGRGSYTNKKYLQIQNNSSVESNKEQRFRAFGSQSKIMGYCTYQGQWKDDEPHGYGIGTKYDGSTYEGHFKNGESCGKGILKCRDGSSYQGEFEHGMFNGSGTYRNTQGDIYRGSWYNGKVLEDQISNTERESMSISMAEDIREITKMI